MIYYTLEKNSADHIDFKNLKNPMKIFTNLIQSKYLLSNE